MSDSRTLEQVMLSSRKILRHQPWKAIYSLLVLTFTMVKMPFYIAYYSFPSLRQHPRWTFQQALMNKIFRIFLYHAAIVEVRTPLNSRADMEKDSSVHMRPPPSETFRGNTQDLDIKPVVVEGFWYPNTYQKGDETKYNIVLHFHGGGYAMCEGSKGDSGYAASLLVNNCAGKVLFPSYRLASNQGGRYPAALQDAITSYKYLLDLAIPPSKIILSGDSAGANLAIGLLRFINENDFVLPSPSSLLLWSPTTDLEAAQSPRNINNNRHSGTDFLPGEFAAWGAVGLIKDTPYHAGPYFTPKNHPFSTNVPIWIQLGGLEILYDDGIEFAENMRHQGNAVELYVEPYANHDILYLGGTTGFKEEGLKASKIAGKFLRGLGGK